MRHVTNRMPRITKAIRARNKALPMAASINNHAVDPGPTRVIKEPRTARDMDLKAIRDHLSSARLALGPEHPLTRRIEKVERSLTPGDLLWRDDAVAAERDLLAITTEIERWPSTAALNEAIKHVADAIELL